jgi:predicted ArsR family transcriptional regulator
LTSKHIAIDHPGARVMSSDAELPERVRAFVERDINTVAELEALLLLTRSEAGRRWTPADLAQRLYITDRAARAVMHALHRRGLVGREGDSVHYAPSSDALRADVEALAASYPRYLIAITNAIHAKPGAALREFLDAFRFREDT